MEYKSKVSYVLDFIFRVLTIFFISFIWIRFFEHNTFLIIFYSTVITIFLSSILTLISYKNYKKITLNKTELSKKQNALFQLSFYTNYEILSLFSEIFNEFSPKKKSNYLILEKDDKKIGVFFNFKQKEINTSFIYEIFNIIKLNRFNKVLILCNSFNKDALTLSQNISDFKINLLNFNEVYKIIQKSGITIKEKTKRTEKTKRNFKEYLSIAFNKSKTKTYFFTGLIFLTTSIFMRYNIYYLIFTTIMFLFSLFSYFNKKYNKTQKVSYF